jgi:hypothetical protein
MLRFFLVIGLALSLAPTASASQLVGRSGPGPVRFLDKNLNVVKGSPRLPGRTASTVLSADGRRLVAITPGKATLFDSRSGRRLGAASIAGNTTAVSLRGKRLKLIVQTTGAVKVKTLNLLNGRSRLVASLDGQLVDSDIVAGQLRVLVTDGKDLRLFNTATRKGSILSPPGDPVLS